MKVLYCEGNVNGTVGGSYYCLFYLVRGLDRRRYDPVVVFHFDHVLLSAFHDAGIKTLVWPKPNPFTFGVALGKPWRVFRPFRPVALVLQKALNFVHRFVFPVVAQAWFLRRNGVKIVHLNNSIVYSHDWMLAAKLAGVKCLTHERAMAGRYPASAKYFARRLDAIICVSDAVRRNMRARGADFGNLLTIYDGLDPNSIRSRTASDILRAEYGIGRDDVVVGMVGNIKEWKGQHTVIRAMDRVRQRFPSVRCLLVGDTASSDQEYERGLRDLVASSGLDRQIIFTGFQRHVADFLLIFDVALLASTIPETFGMVLLEAMACKKPVVAARVGAIPEIVEDGRSGLIFPPGDAERLADAIIELLSDRDRARRFGENGFNRLVQHFQTERTVASVQGLYERLLGGSPFQAGTSVDSVDVNCLGRGCD